MTNVRDPRLPKAPPLVWAPFADLETAFTVRAAFSARDPNPSKDYGIGGVEFGFFVRGPLGCVSWTLLTDWDLPEEARSLRLRGLGGRGPCAGPVTFHAAHPQYEGQAPLDDCTLGFQPCYFDQGFLMGDDVLEAMLRHGHDGLWGVLGRHYLTFTASDGLRSASEASDD